jgi:hypothetical protein
MKKVAAQLLSLGALSLLVFSLLGSVRELSAQDKSPTAQAPQKPPAPPSQSVARINDEVPAAARQMLEVTRKWMSGEMSTPGVTAEIREYSRTNVDGRLTVQYHVLVSGAPKEQTYTMFIWPINAQGPSRSLGGLSLLKDGLISCAGRTPEQCGDPNKIDDPVEWTFNPANGEVFRMVLISQDQKTKLFFAIVPDPVAKCDNDCVLEAIRLMPKHELVMVRGKGFQPNEDLEFKSTTYDEEKDGHSKADARGEYITGLLPFYKDKKSGTTDLQLKGAKCAPALRFEWGDEAVAGKSGSH